MKELTKGYIHYGTDFVDYHDKPEFYLDHSCDQWVIGNVKDAKKFVKDLIKIIEKVEDK